MEIVLASTQKHFADVFRIRTNVFIGEQHVPAQEEIDELDQFAMMVRMNYAYSKVFTLTEQENLHDDKLTRLCSSLLQEKE